MKKEQRAFILMGRSGSGKGTQGHLLEKELLSRQVRVFYNETGALFRSFVKKDLYTARCASQILQEGRREPDFLAAWTWANNFVTGIQGDEWVIIDGTPRSLNEAYLLETAIIFYGWDTTVIFFDVDAKTARERLLLRGRQDDNDQSIAARMEWFEKDVLPAVRFFASNPAVRFLHIDARRNVNDISNVIKEKVLGE